ncbi:MAG: ABC-type amino acid transport substrate-binding protein [Polaribacter sp.]|jgi:ABC-type amino acid transport substrate-binding protein
MYQRIKFNESATISLALMLFFLLLFSKHSLSNETSLNLVNSNKIKCNDTLVIATMTDNPPYGMKTPSGEFTDFYTEFWMLWAKVNHRKVKFLSGKYAQSLRYIDDDTADFHSGLFVNEQRKKLYQFSLPIDNIDNGLFYLKSNGVIKPLEDLDNILVAIHPDYDPIRYVKKAFPNSS